jgi:hypothetical protein
MRRNWLGRVVEVFQVAYPKLNQHLLYSAKLRSTEAQPGKTQD